MAIGLQAGSVPPTAMASARDMTAGTEILRERGTSKLPLATTPRAQEITKTRDETLSFCDMGGRIILVVIT